MCHWDPPPTAAADVGEVQWQFSTADRFYVSAVRVKAPTVLYTLLMECCRPVDTNRCVCKEPASHSKRPQRHGDKVSVSGRRAPGSKPDSPEDPSCMAPIAHHAVAKCPPAAVIGSLERVPAQAQSLSSDHG
ncbi:hypothetical protein AVEN_50117-1 [Araneus ventricosus]|uniref:Uncharacterized protein n=1 Tax=Araneus ventricosus TaxID=182803 RepID=A0A4Y2FNZ6_ARAVE|nr:hypothetical protein AVEN_50117-1 [Araneus ventricosus]